jgi:2-phospho-L-lactate/phosphoenolpyruvate guanylyltransferase
MAVEDNMAVTTIVIPVRGPGAKSRLDSPLRAELARAMALDTIEAALEVAPVIVVTDETMRVDAEALGARTVTDPGTGLNRAIEAALSHTTKRTAVLLGDVPGLDPDELQAALAEAAAHDRAMVADADGDGTVLLVAALHELNFGPGSRRLHAASGYVELTTPWLTLRRDVDLLEHLDGLGSGRRTLELLRQL